MHAFSSPTTFDFLIPTGHHTTWGFYISHVYRTPIFYFHVFIAYFSSLNVSVKSIFLEDCLTKIPSLML